MIDIITHLFENVAIKYGNMRLYFFRDAIALINECETCQIKILGFDSFKLSAQGIQPFSEFSPNFSGLDKTMTWDKAREELSKYSQADFLFEIIYEK